MWYYKDNIIQNIQDFPENAFGFIYKITNISDISSRQNYFYIGKKQLWSERNVKLGKKELALQAELKKPGRAKTKKLVKKESDWKSYYGSEPEIKNDVSLLGKDSFKREILHIALTKKELTYMEIKFQFILEVLERTDCYNSNIEGRYFRSDFTKKEFED